MIRQVLLALWALSAVMLIGCEVLARLGGRTLAKTSDVLARLSGTRWRLWAVFVGWMWLGWHFFAR